MSDHMNEDFWLEKLSHSRFFTSKKDVDLLHYLLRSTQEGKDLKETIIAIDFFGKDSSFNPGAESIVRSSIYNLRKKLESYYLDEGENDNVRFIIPKGQYQVKIKELEKKNANKLANVSFSSKPGLKILLLFTTVIMLFFIFLYVNDNQKTEKQRNTNKNPVWNYFVESENSLLIVLGDYFMMQKTELPDSSFSFVRNPDINNQTEFFIFLEKHPEQGKKLKKLGQSYLGEEIPKCFLQILHIFENTGKKINLKYSSELSLSDIRENDLIFIGDYGTLNILKPFFEKTGLRYSSSPQSVCILNEHNDTTAFYYLDNPNQSVFQNDYAIVASVKSYSDKRILFLTSFLPFGKSEALFKLQENNLMLEISDSLSVLPSEWSLLMKVSGLQSSGFDYEVINFKNNDPYN